MNFLRALHRKWFVTFFLSLSILCLFFLLPNVRKPYLTIIGEVKMADGLGRQAVELLDTLYGEIDLGFIPLRTPCLEEVPLRIQKLITHPNKKLGQVVLYEGSLPTPAKAHKRMKKLFKTPKNPGEIRIVYSMLESTRIPPEWTEIFHTYFDAIAVPDPFLVDVYKSSGVKIPIFVLPLGLNLDLLLKEPLKATQNKPFRFINAAALIPRKNHEGLILAFHKAFGDNPEVQLHINYRYGDPLTIQKVTTLIQSLEAKNIFLTPYELDSKNYIAFLKSGDLFISLSKGEGFSIQPREAMALGLPVIISNNTAHTTIVEGSLVQGVNCPTREKAFNIFLHCECGEQFLPDIDEAARLLKEAYVNYEDFLAQAEQRRLWASHYQYKNLKSLYLNLIKPTSLELGVKDEVTASKLTTSSWELYNKYLNLKH